MKKLTILLITIIIANCISITPLAFESTDKDEIDAYRKAIQFLNKITSNIYFNTDYDLSVDTFGHYTNIKEEILEKAKQYEDEIRANHRYHYYEDNQWYWDHEDEVDENGNYLITPPSKQYDNTPIEDVISSFPTFIEKKASYYKAVYAQDGQPTDDVNSFAIYNLFKRELPRSVTVSESGFAYIDVRTAYILLYKYEAPAEDMWFVCDYSVFWNEYDDEYRFHSEDMDVEKELIAKGYTPLSADVNSDSDSDTDAEVDSANESESETEAPPQDEKSNNFVTWILCAESTIILVLALVLAFKKKK